MPLVTGTRALYVKRMLRPLLWVLYSSFSYVVFLMASINFKRAKAYAYAYEMLTHKWRRSNNTRGPRSLPRESRGRLMAAGEFAFSRSTRGTRVPADSIVDVCDRFRNSSLIRQTRLRHGDCFTVTGSPKRLSRFLLNFWHRYTYLRR